MDLHAFLRSHKHAATVNVRSKTNSLLGDLAELCQGENLKSAAIGENRAIPIHKLADTAHVADESITRTEVQMVGVGKLDLTVKLAELHRVNTAFDRSTRANVHKDGGLDISVYGVEDAASRATVLSKKFKHNL